MNQSLVDGLHISKEDGICTVRLNRPRRYNAISMEMYGGIRDILNETAHDDNVRILLITGTGRYYSSGNDLSNFMKYAETDTKIGAFKGKESLQSFVQAFISYPKLLVCAVNGPAIGISVTVMGLCDLVYACENATFHTPFMTLGQSPEGCSSYTFPKIMGNVRANDMLIGGRKLTAREAFDRGLVTDVIPHSEFQQTIQEKLKYLAALPPKSILYTKALRQSREKDILERVNREECDLLVERWTSDECMDAVMNFLMKKSKL